MNRLVELWIYLITRHGFDFETGMKIKLINDLTNAPVVMKIEGRKCKFIPMTTVTAPENPVEEMLVKQLRKLIYDL